VLAFKHGKRIALAPMLARMAAARLPELDGEWLVVPVPLHRWRLWRRRFKKDNATYSGWQRQSSGVNYQMCF
jgi:predicted amidophosphoribosyltransferase